MLRFTGNEKAILGGLTSALVALNVQVQQTGLLDTKEVLTSLAAYVATHLAVWLATNTPVTPKAEVTDAPV